MAALILHRQGAWMEGSMRGKNLHPVLFMLMILGRQDIKSRTQRVCWHLMIRDHHMSEYIMVAVIVYKYVMVRELCALVIGLEQVCPLRDVCS